MPVDECQVLAGWASGPRRSRRNSRRRPWSDSYQHPPGRDLPWHAVGVLGADLPLRCRVQALGAVASGRGSNVGSDGVGNVGCQQRVERWLVVLASDDVVEHLVNRVAILDRGDPVPNPAQEEGNDGAAVRPSPGRLGPDAVTGPVGESGGAGDPGLGG
jgi:hypothetical protein